MTIQLFRKYYKGIRLHQISVCLTIRPDIYFHPYSYITPSELKEAYKTQLDNLNKFIEDERVYLITRNCKLINTS